MASECLTMLVISVCLALEAPLMRSSCKYYYPISVLGITQMLTILHLWQGRYLGIAIYLQT